MKATLHKLPFLILTLALLSSCAVSNVGGTYTNKQFVYPNSNITPLGEVSSSITKWQFLAINPISFRKRDHDKAVKEALSKYPDADILINGSADWTATWILGSYLVMYTYTLKGIAAKEEVGMQDIGQ